jgi:hypothetical protein
MSASMNAGMGGPWAGMGGCVPRDPLLHRSRIRIEVVSDGEGTLHGIVALPATPDSHVAIVLSGGRAGGWQVAKGLVASALWDAPVADLVRPIPTGSLTEGDAVGLGIVANDPRPATYQARECVGLAPGPGDLMVFGLLAALDVGGIGDDMRTVMECDGRDRALETGILAVHPGVIKGLCPVSAPFPSELPDRAAVPAMRAAMGIWVAAMHRAILGECGPHLGDGTWSWRLQAWVDGPGNARRRQAVALQPAFAPVAMADPALVALIDGGRPFEAKLGERIGTWEVMAGIPSPTRALMRRLRTVPPCIMAGDVACVVAVSSFMPLEWLPREAAGWIALVKRIKAAMPIVRGMRLGGAGTWAREMADHVGAMSADEAEVMALATKATGVGDACSAMDRELVIPLLQDAGLPWLELAELGSTGNGILCEGERLDRILERSAAWHEAVATARGIPDDDDPTPWPALFPEFTASNGVVIRCLVDASELADEGYAGRDASGETGLNHCVGSYAPRCREGSVHVATVRMPRSGGGYRRLSTLSMTFDIGRGTVRIEQHYGISNTPPPPESVVAARQLVAHLGLAPPSPAKPAPARPRVLAARFGLGHMALEPVFRRWRPLLPRRFADMDIHGFRDAVLGMAVQGKANP